LWENSRVDASGFAGPIYCTPATAEVAHIVLNDAAKIKRRCGIPESAGDLTKSGADSAALCVERCAGGDEPDAEDSLWAERGPGRRRVVQFFRRRTYPGGGVCGAEVERGGGNRSLLFTADIGRYNSPIIRDPQTINAPADFVITESTYGGRLHAPMSEVGPQLLDAVKCASCTTAGCSCRRLRWKDADDFVVHPAVHRGGKIPPIRIYVDSPMGVQISKVHRHFRDYYDEETRRAIGEQDLFGISRAGICQRGAGEQEDQQRSGAVRDHRVEPDV